MTLAINVLLWLVVGTLALIAAMRGRVLLNEGSRAGVMEFILLLPRIGIGVVGSGFVAEALPNEWIAPWLGPESGFFGVLIATLGGALDTGRAGRRIFDWRCGTKKRCRRATGYRLFDCLGLVRDPSAHNLGSADDAARAWSGSARRFHYRCLSWPRRSRCCLGGRNTAFFSGIPLAVAHASFGLGRRAYTAAGRGDDGGRSQSGPGIASHFRRAAPQGGRIRPAGRRRRQPARRLGRHRRDRASPSR